MGPRSGTLLSLEITLLPRAVIRSLGGWTCCHVQQIFLAHSLGNRLALRRCKRMAIAGALTSKLRRCKRMAIAGALTSKQIRPGLPVSVPLRASATLYTCLRTSDHRRTPETIRSEE